MKNVSSVFIAVIILFTSCSAYKNTTILSPTRTPVTEKDIIYSYSSDLIRDPDNNLRKAWANRKNVHVLNIEIINTSDKPIHGSQLSFYTKEKKLEIVDHKLAATKLKTKSFPTIIYFLPVILVGVLIYAALVPPPVDWDGDGFADHNNTSSKKKDKDPMRKANPIQKALYNFNISATIIHPGEKITGLVAFQSEKKIENIDIQINKTDLKILDSVSE